jgi:hypothetical protein
VSLATCKMQLAFDKTHCRTDQMSDRVNEATSAAVHEVEQAVVTSRASSLAEYEDIYRLMVSSALLRAGMGPPDDLGVIRECTAAMESVLPVSELGVFMALSVREKREQLRYLASIVGGIRLFNKAAGKGGSAIADLAADVPVECAATLADCHRDAVAAAELASLYGTAQAAVQVAEHKEHLFRGAAAAQQRFAFAADLHRDVVLVATRVHELCNKAATTHRKLDAAVSSHTAVPTSEVYPNFIALADAYARLRVCRATLANISDVRHAFAESVKVHAAAAAASPDAGALAAARTAPLKEARVSFTARLAALHAETTRALDALVVLQPTVRDVVADLPAPTPAQAAEAAAAVVPIDAVDDGVKLTGGREGPMDLLLPSALRRPTLAPCTPLPCLL